MKKQQTFSLILAISSALLASNAFAQTTATGTAQTPPAKTQSSSGASSGTTAAKPQTGTAAKKPGGAAAAAKPGPPAMPVVQTDSQKASYVIGTNIGRQLKQLGIDDIDSALLARGLKDFFTGAKSPLTDEQSQTALMAYAAEVKKRLETKNQKEG